MLASYLIPEHWVSVSSFNLWAEQLISDSNIDDWRPAGLELAALITLTLSLLARTRANLGAPLLQTLAALLLLTDACLQLTGNDFAPLVREGSVYTVSLIALLLLAQFIGVVHGLATHSQQLDPSPVALRHPCRVDHRLLVPTKQSR